MKEGKVRERVGTEPSEQKRTKGSFRCIVSIDLNTYAPYFIGRAGFPRICQDLLHTIDQANSMCPLQGATPA